MIYGGSSVFDHDNPGTTDWPHRVERRLRESGFPAVEVINAGIPGHASSDAVGRLLAEGHLFDPDYVLYYGEWNDIKDFRETDPLLRYRLPALSLSEENDPLFTYQNPMDRWLCGVSQLYVRLRERYYTWNFRIGSEGVLPEGSYASTLSETALRQYRLNVQTFVDVARNAGAVPVLVTEARLVSKKNEDADRKRINYEMVLLTHEALYHAFEEEDRILREISNEKEVYLTDSSAVLSGRSEFFLDAVHLTDRGSEALSSIVATSIASLLNNPNLPAANHPGIQTKLKHQISQSFVP
jgi:lysophospholipase L1-like esterase